MKWGFLAILLGGILPLAQWLRQNPSGTQKAWVSLGFLPFLLKPLHLYVAPISWAGWAGYVQGAEVSALDGLAIAIYLGLPRAARQPLPFRLSMVLYFVAVLFSIFQAQVPMASLFYAWQLARMFLLYAVVTKACADERFAPALLRGMAIGLCIEACLAAWEFSRGDLQAAGTLGHQNLLGFVSHFVVFPLFALLLAGQPGRLQALGILAGIVTAVLTASRATLGFAGVGYVELFLLSAWRKWTSLKAKVLMMGVLLAVVVAPLALWSLERRFAAVPLAQDYDERAAFEKAASMIVFDHPMGIGANQYVLIANTMGYNERAGVAWTSSGAIVHNIYWLVTAETGYFGLVAFVLLLARPLLTAFNCGWRARNDWRGDLLLGLGVSLLTVYVHSFFEWALATFPAQYMFALTCGLVAGVAQQLGYWGRAPVRSVHAASNQLARPIGKVAQN